MLRQVMTAVIDLLSAIPPVRFLVGLVDPRWRPLWAALWLVVVPSILFLTVRRLTHRRARRQSVRKQATPPERPGAAPGKSGEHQRAVAEPEERSRVLKPASTPPPSPAPTPPSAPPPPRGVPVPVVVGAVVAGLVAVAVTALFLPNKSAPPPKAPAVSTPAAADTGLDVKWRSGRMDRGDCVGTFEVTRGGGTHAQFVAFVMDTTGAIIARDTGSVDAAKPGVFIDFRFRRVTCERIYDWQLQVSTPKARTP